MKRCVLGHSGGQKIEIWPANIGKLRSFSCWNWNARPGHQGPLMSDINGRGNKKHSCRKDGEGGKCLEQLGLIIHKMGFESWRYLPSCIDGKNTNQMDDLAPHDSSAEPCPRVWQVGEFFFGGWMKTVGDGQSVLNWTGSWKKTFSLGCYDLQTEYVGASVSLKQRQVIAMTGFWCGDPWNMVEALAWRTRFYLQENGITWW